MPGFDSKYCICGCGRTGFPKTTKTKECYCHDPINKIGAHYHVIEIKKEKQNGK